MSTPKARPTLSRRTLLAGGGVLGGAALLGGRVRDDGRATRRCNRRQRSPTRARRCTWPAPTAGCRCRRTPRRTRRSTPTRWRPAPFDTYVFGFRDVTGLTAAQIAAQRGHAQISAPMLAFDQEDDIYHHADQPRAAAAARPVRRAHPALARLPQRDPALRRRARALARRAGGPGLHLLLPPARRRDLHVPLPLRGRGARPDGHDRHGVRAAEAEQDRVAGTRRARSTPTTTATARPRYDREFAFMMTELWSAAHYRDAHIQVSDWTDYAPSFWLLNGRGYPDTLAPERQPDATAAAGGCSTSRSPR